LQEFNSHAPIYIQIVMDIKRLITSGTWPAGGRVQSVRELAADFTVNPNTMQRALTELERDGLLYTERTSGRFVTNDTELIAKVKDEQAALIISQMATELTSMGYNKQQIINLIDKKI
jgi:DNA-binding transcriptional regulator YhcF (GntR family)